MSRNAESYSQEEKQKTAQMGLANRGRQHTEEELLKMRLAHLGKKHTLEEIAKIRLSHLGPRNPNYGKHPSPETRVKLSASRTDKKNSFYGKHHTEEIRERLRLAASGPRNFNYGKPRDSYIVRKIMRSNHIKPNKAELRLQAILNTYFPDQWEFVGDGHFIVGGLCPDFLNISSKKEVIELFGSYWHSEKQVKRANQTEAGRVRHYAAYDLQCLVIWEHELKTEAQLVEKIRAWA